MARFFKDSGVPNNVIGKMATAPPGEIHYLGDNELTQMGARFMDDNNFAQAAGGTSMSQSTATPPTQQPAPPTSAGVIPNSTPRQSPQPSVDEPLRAEHDRNFAKKWNQILGRSKAQHRGVVAS